MFDFEKPNIEIAEISEKYGAKVPFIRDKSLADDFTGTFPVTVDAFKKIQTIDPEIEAICCIYATAPLLTAEHLAHAHHWNLSKALKT